MPKRSKYPGLRSHSWRAASGEVKTAYYLDRRKDGMPELPLGTDFARALAQWHELTQDRPLHVGTLKEAFDRWAVEVLPGYRETTRRDYGLCLTQLRPVMQGARWADITLPVLRRYLTTRTGKTRANRELAVLSIVWNWARLEGLTELPYPAAGLSRARWKNPEKAREIQISQAMFDAVYAEADQVLRDAMDIASATGLRLTDTVSVPIPVDGVLRGKASKTAKAFAIDVSESPVLAPLVARRRTYKAAHLRLLSTPTGMVSLRMLSDRWIKARDKAASKPENKKIAADIRRMILRDMRKFAAQSAPTLAAAATALDHDDQRLTAKHYRQSADVRKAGR